MTEKRYLKWYNKVGYGSGDIAGNVVYASLRPPHLQRFYSDLRNVLSKNYKLFDFVHILFHLVYIFLFHWIL